MSLALPRRVAALLVLVAAFAALLLTPRAAGAAPAATALTGSQQRTVLDLVDDVCGDTWCEGDHAFDFRRFTCDTAARTCTLTLRIAPYTDERLRWYWRSGKVSGFVTFRQMVSTSPTGQHALTPAFYDAVNALIGRVEDTVPHGRA